MIEGCDKKGVWRVRFLSVQIPKKLQASQIWRHRTSWPFVFHESSTRVYNGRHLMRNFRRFLPLLKRNIEPSGSFLTYLFSLELLLCSRIWWNRQLRTLSTTHRMMEKWLLYTFLFNIRGFVRSKMQPPIKITYTTSSSSTVNHLTKTF